MNRMNRLTCTLYTRPARWSRGLPSRPPVGRREAPRGLHERTIRWPSSCTGVLGPDDPLSEADWLRACEIIGE